VKSAKNQPTFRRNVSHSSVLKNWPGKKQSFWPSVHVSRLRVASISVHSSSFSCKCFGLTGHLQVYKLVSLRLCKTTATVASSLFDWQCSNARVRFCSFC
jgi:hypothetical protein